MKDKATHFIEQWGFTDDKGNTEPSSTISASSVCEIDDLNMQLEYTKQMPLKTICVFLIYPKKQN